MFTVSEGTLKTEAFQKKKITDYRKDFMMSQILEKESQVRKKITSSKKRIHIRKRLYKIIKIR